MKEKNIYFIRHGESMFNKEKRYTGLIDAPLSDKGIKEAEDVIESLKDKNISAIYSSSLNRAIETAKIIARELNLPVVIIDELRERHFGEFEGQKIFNYRKKYFPTGETLYRHRRVIATGLNKLKSQNNILIVAHSGTYKALAHLLLKVNLSRSIENASLVCFRRDDGGVWNI